MLRDTTKIYLEKKRGEIRLREDLWVEQGCLNDLEDASLVDQFLEKEIKESLDEMKVNSAPGPDGFTVGFFKSFWEQVKGSILEMFDKFYKGELNLSRLNYGLISLIHKSKEVNTIKQYMPICLLGVDYKWFTKVLTKRLTRVADFVISLTQTAFIQ
jgi:hypothetical protein